MPDIFEERAQKRKQQQPSQSVDIFEERAAKRRRSATSAPNEPGSDVRGLVPGITPPGAPSLPEELGGPPSMSSYRNLRTGRVTTSPTNERPVWTVLDTPVTGGSKAAKGALRLGNAESLRDAAGGLHEVVGGTFEAMTPLMAAGAVTAPIRTAATLGATMATQEGIEAGLKKLGLPEEYAAVAGDLGAIIAGGAAHKMGEAAKAGIVSTLRKRWESRKAGTPVPASPDQPAAPANPVKDEAPARDLAAQVEAARKENAALKAGKKTAAEPVKAATPPAPGKRSSADVRAKIEALRAKQAPPAETPEVVSPPEPAKPTEAKVEPEKPAEATSTDEVRAQIEKVRAQIEKVRAENEALKKGEETPKPETKSAKVETKPAEPETKPAKTETEKPPAAEEKVEEPVKPKVEEAAKPDLPKPAVEKAAPPEKKVKAKKEGREPISAGTVEKSPAKPPKNAGIPKWLSSPITTEERAKVEKMSDDELQQSVDRLILEHGMPPKMSGDKYPELKAYRERVDFYRKQIIEKRSPIMTREESAPQAAEQPKATAAQPVADTTDVPHETSSAITGIHNTARTQDLGKVRIQPLDAAGKPTGEAIEMDPAVDSKAEVARVAQQLGGHSGLVAVEPVSDAARARVRKWSTNIPKPKPAGMRQGAVMESRETIGSYLKGTQFQYRGPKTQGEGAGHMFTAPDGNMVFVSDMDMKSRFNGKVEPVAPEGFKGMAAEKAGERGAAVGDLLTGGIRKVIEGDPDEPKGHLSVAGSIKNMFVRNLSQLEKAAVAGHTAAVRMASSSSQLQAIMWTAVPRIRRALKEGGGPAWDEFRATLVESRLMGAKDRWVERADAITTMDDKSIKKDFGEWIGPLLKKIQGVKGLPQDLHDTGTALLEMEDYDLLRAFAAEHFLDASDRVASVMDPAVFQDNVANPGFQEGLRIYKENVEQPINESHAINEGIFSDALGPLDTYYPLTPIEELEAESNVSQGPGRRLPYHRPDNLNNWFTTGLAETYDTSIEKFKERMYASIRANNKAGLIDVLRDAGLSHPQEEGDPGNVFHNHGVEYKGARVESGSKRTIIKDGQVINLPARFDIVPTWLEEELRPILANDHMSPTIVDRMIGVVNEFALSGPADFLFHSANLMGALVSNTPFLGTSLQDKAMSVPFAKRFAAIGKVLWTDTTTAEAATDLVEMSKIGLVPERFGTVTYDAQNAADLGAKRVYSLSGALFGEKGVDVKSRLVMYRIAKGINPEATPNELFHFVNQLGNYTSSLQSRVERAAKRSGLSPFYTAGSTMMRNGINAWTGLSPMPSDAMSNKVWQQMTGGGIAAAAIWVSAYQVSTGKWPWEDNRAKLMQIPVSDEIRNSSLGQIYWGKDSDDVGYINLNFFNPLVGRGANALGLQGAFDTVFAGGNSRQAKNAAVAGTVNAIAHPFLGPLPKAAFVGVTGSVGQQHEPYMFPGPSALPAGKKNATAGEKAAMFAKELNSFYGQAAINMGFGPQEEKYSEAGFWGRMLHVVTDLAFPNLVGRPANPEKKQKALEREDAAVNKPRE